MLWDEIKRTSQSGLTDDELMIFDFWALNGGASLGILNRESFPIHNNSVYSHSFSEKELEERFSVWKQQGWIVEKDNGEERFYTLTFVGGEIWESERLPCWDLFCLDTSYLTDDEQQSWLEIFCVKEEVGRAFAKTALACGLYHFPLEQLSLTEAAHNEPLDWKSFPRVWSWKVQLQEGLGGLDWEVYEKERSWWRSLDELQRWNSF